MVSDGKYWFEEDDSEKKEEEKSFLSGENGVAGIETEEGDEDFFERSFSENEPPVSEPSPSLTENSFGTEAGIGGPEEEGGKTDGEDPHARHYHSDFASRVKSEEDPRPVGGGEKRKAVRRSMLKKLLKYDYRAHFRFLLPCYIVLISLAVLCAICLPIARHISTSGFNEVGQNVFFSILSTVTGFYAIAVFVSSFCCFGNSVSRFYKNLFTSEGYLTLSIPASPEEHILSKFISGVVTIFLTILVGILSLAIVALPYGATVYPFIGDLLRMIGEVFSLNTVESVLMTVEIILSIVCGVSFVLMLIFACTCMGQLFVNKNRAVSAVVSLVVWIAIWQIVSMFTRATGVLSGLFNFSGATHVLLWLGILIDVGLSTVAFFLQRYILKNKVNLG